MTSRIVCLLPGLVLPSVFFFLLLLIFHVVRLYLQLEQSGKLHKSIADDVSLALLPYNYTSVNVQICDHH